MASCTAWREIPSFLAASVMVYAFFLGIDGVAAILTTERGIIKEFMPTLRAEITLPLIFNEVKLVLHFEGA
jgi:hypothetical protein